MGSRGGKASTPIHLPHPQPLPYFSFLETREGREGLHPSEFVIIIMFNSFPRLQSTLPGLSPPTTRSASLRGGLEEGGWRLKFALTFNRCLKRAKVNHLLKKLWSDL